jgi:hypothetical protein
MRILVKLLPSSPVIKSCEFSHVFNNENEFFLSAGKCRSVCKYIYHFQKHAPAALRNNHRPGKRTSGQGRRERAQRCMVLMFHTADYKTKPTHTFLLLALACSMPRRPFSNTYIYIYVFHSSGMLFRVSRTPAIAFVLTVPHGRTIEQRTSGGDSPIHFLRRSDSNCREYTVAV